MKTKSHIILLAGLLFCSNIALAQSGGTFSLEWNTIDGGGGTSTGGAFSLSGTVAQPDAGKLSGGNFQLDGGFWSVFSVVQTGAPLLSITRTATNTLAVHWPFPSKGFFLQQNAGSLDSANWSNVADTIYNDGTNKFLIVDPPTGNRFYRLIKQ